MALDPTRTPPRAHAAPRPSVRWRMLALLSAPLLAAGVALVPSLPAQQPLPRLRAHGTRWIDETGNRVILKGCNLGNWLIQEMWMHNMGTSGIPDQHTLEQVLANRFGASARDALLDVYRDNYITQRDLTLIRSFGMNVVRLPFVYTLLTDEQPTFQLKTNAWVYLDRAIDMAEAEGIHTILDLHGAPGRQSTEQHTGRQNVNQLFFNAQYQQLAKWLWGEIASRYRNRSAVAAYDLLNEPWGSSRGALRAVALDLYGAVRAVDADHVVILPGYWDGFDFYGAPASQGLTNVAHTMHFYPGIFDGRPARGAARGPWRRCGSW